MHLLARLIWWKSEGSIELGFSEWCKEINKTIRDRRGDLVEIYTINLKLISGNKEKYEGDKKVL